MEMSQVPGGERVPPIGIRVLSGLHPVLFVFFALGVVFILYQVVAGAATLLLSGGKFTEENISLVRWSTLLGQLLFILVPTLVLVRLRGEEARTFLRLRAPRPGQLFAVVVATVFLQQMLQGYMALQDSIPMPDVLRRYVEMFRAMFEETYRMLVSAGTPLEFAFVVVTVALVPAVCEELLFRGLVQSALARAAGGFAAAAYAGVLFGAYHLNPFSIVPLCALGFFFGFLVHRSGSVFLAVAAHFLNNFAACTAIYFDVNDDFVLLVPEGGATLEIQLLNFAVCSIVFSGAMLLFMRSTREARP